MSEAKSAILGSYSDFKLVKTRSVVQVVIEVPLERATEVTNLLGLPNPGEEIAVAIARIDTSKIAAPAPDHRPAKPSQLAGILCSEGAFNKWASELGYPDGKAYIYDRCTVRSRSELDTDKRAAARFMDMRAEYKLWLNGVEA